MNAIVALIFLTLLLNLCQTEGTAKTIVWDPETLVRIHEGGVYARMVRLESGDILCCFEAERKSWVRRSKDNGRTWEEAVRVAEAPSGGAANPELLQLANGWVLLFYNERPEDGIRPFTIRVSVSKDDGQTWAPHSLAYEAGTAFDNGCWEPAAIQLPSGEIQLFFANEKPYPDTHEQEITLLRSFDNGKSWREPETVSFRAGHRDGMPVPLILNDGRGIVIAIEDNGYALEFHPVIIHTSMERNWRQRYASGASPRRWLALEEPINRQQGAAPYIRQMPSGETVLSIQSKMGRRYPRMEVYVGDENAHGFGGRSVPFEVREDEGAWWNSLFVKDAETITAVSSWRGGVWAIDGRIVR